MRRRWPRPSNEISRSASFRAALLSTRAMPATCRKKALGFERGHAAGASCGDCLTIDFVHNVATREHAQYAGSRRARPRAIDANALLDQALRQQHEIGRAHV